MSHVCACVLKVISCIFSFVLVVSLFVLQQQDSFSREI